MSQRMVPYIIKTPCKQKSATAQLYISGDVTVKTLTASAFARYEQQCRLKETDSIDFSQVGKADSACVSLLLNALRRTDKKTDHSKYSRFRPRTGRTLRN